MADNAIYTPNPASITVTVYRDASGVIKASSGPAHLVALDGDVIRTEAAKVVGRGNLLANGRERYYQVELADGSRHYVIGEGS